MKGSLLEWLRRRFASRVERPELPTQIRLISNADLVEEDLPADSANWDQWSGIPVFAASFNGYQYWGSSTKCFEVGSLEEAKSLHDLTLTQLRTALFCRYRAICHDDGHLTALDLPRARAIIAEIRDRVRRHSID